jgi:hypothetical protein
MGTIFLTVIGGIVAWLVRSYMNSQERLAVRNRLEACSAADPIELDDVRVANSNLVHLNARTFSQAMELVQSQLDVSSSSSSSDQTGCHMHMTYPQFVTAVRTALYTIQTLQEQSKLTDTNAAAQVAVTVQLGHILDRIALSMLLKTPSKSSASAAPEIVKQPNQQWTTVALPLAQWWTLLSLAMDVPPRQRIPILLQAMLQSPPSSSSYPTAVADTETGDKPLEASTAQTDDNDALTYPQVVELVSYLQASCQLAPDAQIVADPSRQYPLQRYTIGTPHQLVDLALATMATTSSSSSPSNTTPAPPLLKHDAGLYDCQALEAILTSKSVCAWGECYRKTKP